MDPQYKSAASKLDEILKEHTSGLPQDETSNLRALIKDLKDDASRKIGIEKTINSLENTLKEKQPGIWKQIVEIRNSLATDSTGIVGAESLPAPPEHKGRALGDTEMDFMVKSFRVIIEILETNRDTEPFPKPDERQKETVGECYEYALKVASLCKERKSDLERVSKIIENLHNQVMEVNVDQAQGKPETVMTTGFKKGGVDNGSTGSKYTEPGMTPQIEKRAKAASSGLEKTIDMTSGPKKVTQETEPTVPTKIDPDIAHELEIKGAAVSSALQQMKDMKGQVQTLKNANELLMQQLDALHESVIGVEHKTSRNKPSAAPGNEPDMTGKILTTFQEKKNEAEYAACLLEELSSFAHATNKDDDGSILSRPQNVETSQDFKEKDAKKVDNSRQKSSQCVHDENLMKYYRYASHVLKDMKESERLRIDLGIKKVEIEDLRTRLKNIQDEKTKLMEEANSLRTRMSEHAGALLNHDNPAIADLSDPNRATKLGEKYLELYDNQWTDAFSKLQTEYSSASDEELTGYLYTILVDGYAFCADARQAQRFNLQEIMLNPTCDVTESQIRPKEEVSKSFSNILSDAAKLGSTVASGNIAKAFIKHEGTKSKHGKMIKLCKIYIQECVQLCWYMQVQTPPLCLDLSTTKGHAFEKNTYKEYTTRGKKIAFVVWPALFLHENGPLVSKGVAQGDSTPKQADED